MNRLLSLALVAIATQPAMAADIASTEVTIPKPSEVQREYSPHINESFPQRVFWGDTHLHTNISPDAGMLKNLNVGPDDAYRFARGEQVTANNGMQAKLVRPLDFLVIADHSEYMGLIPEILGGSPELLKDPVGKQWYEWFQEGPEGQCKVFINFAEDLAANKGRIEFGSILRLSLIHISEPTRLQV